MPSNAAASVAGGTTSPEESDESSSWAESFIPKSGRSRSPMLKSSDSPAGDDAIVSWERKSLSEEESAESWLNTGRSRPSMLKSSPDEESAPKEVNKSLPEESEPSCKEDEGWLSITRSLSNAVSSSKGMSEGRSAAGGL